MALAAIKADGSAVTWGNAKSGGDSSEIAPLLMEGVVEVCANTPAFAAIKADGSVVTWGNAKIWQRFLSGCSTSDGGRCPSLWTYRCFRGHQGGRQCSDLGRCRVW
ncbi:unnamed protein product [Polarella glacialis]|uniref:Uncharacterized protein n=1 Tax=Polarella glacialis TaxID=89957 RepID=A0A813FDY8_POLGL|nr:unnamed protein product [Polarella glacialis]